MQGLNPLTMQCIYSTPCGWCTKRDKKCDKKIGPESILTLKIPDNISKNIIEDTKNKIYQSFGVSEELIKENKND